jgi:hypothetical protein
MSRAVISSTRLHQLLMAAPAMRLTVLTLVGGTAITVATITVDSVDMDGVILTASVTTGGEYSAIPSDPVAVTGGSGADATFNLDWTDLGDTWYVRITYDFPFGEQPASVGDNLAVSAGDKLVVESPASTTFATGWNVYVGTSAGTEGKQNAEVIPFGTDWTMPLSGLAVGDAVPDTITLDCNVAQNWIGTLADSVTLANPDNLAAGREFNIWLTQDATGSRVLTYASQWEAAGGVTTIALTTTASKKDLISAVADSATTITARIQKAIAH